MQALSIFEYALQLYKEEARERIPAENPVERMTRD